jgi:predicted O-linked N-acetylglucosamine transferase (SPINDLY family)
MSSELFAETVRRIVSRDFKVEDLFSVVDELTRAGDKALAVELYGMWLRHNAEDPLACAVQFNLGTILLDSKNWDAAKAAFEEAIKANPAFIPPYINLGNVSERLGRLEEAIGHWNTAAALLSQVTAEGLTYKTTALKQIGRVLEQNRIEARAEEAMRLGIDLDPLQTDVIQHWVALRQIQCKWPVVAPWGRATHRVLVRNLSPLSAAGLVDDPIFQLANAFNYSKSEVLAAHIPVIERTALHDIAKDRRLKIGYVSSDLRDHAVGFLTSEIFELHDRTAVEIYSYYCGIALEDATKTRIRGASDHWIDITSMTDEVAARRIADDGIDILVDLNGYTKDGRTRLFAMRPAPVIVNWLGYPGTTGSRFHNYIIADPRIIPVDSEKFYSEKVLRLPCYQPTDRKRIVSARRPTRAEAGLPEDAIVFCCFNGTQKITQAMFANWVAILHRVPKGVLWLLGGTAETNERLLQAATNLGIDRSRIVIAERMANPDHLARYPLADIFLDTWPYGAHTTASDALWMGVPVVTLLGRGFASRVCASLVEAAGLPELVCTSPEEYVDLAVSLAEDGASRQAFRMRLEIGRGSSLLFDTPLLVTHLERLYREMWHDFANGTLPQPDLSNLEALHDIACAPGFLDFDSLEATRPYEQLYRERLIARSAMTAAATDPRVAVGATRPSLAAVTTGEALRARRGSEGGAPEQPAPERHGLHVA